VENARRFPSSVGCRRGHAPKAFHRASGGRSTQPHARHHLPTRNDEEPEKSAVDLAMRRDFLGYGFWVAKGGRIKRRVARKALGTMKERVREITSRTGGRSLSAVAAELKAYLVGWREYFKLAETPHVFDDLDKWLRHRLRCLQLRQWKQGPTVYRELRARGVRKAVASEVARFTPRWWHNSALLLNSAMPKRFFDELGVPRLAP